jgi:hypothetical protein
MNPTYLGIIAIVFSFGGAVFGLRLGSA